MKKFKFTDSPIEVHGIPFWKENGRLERIPDGEIEKFPRLLSLGKRCTGGRVCFRTDSKNVTVRMTLETLTFDVGMSIFGCSSINVMIGDRKNARFAGLVNPKDYETKTAEKTFKKSKDEQEITLYLPRNDRVADIEIEIDDDADIFAPTPYENGPVMFYGSSITEGGCSCRVTNAYNSLVCRWLDADYYNFGFSGSARGEQEMAELLNRIKTEVFVLDYDHNSPTADELQATHEPFFKTIRKANPTMPIIILSAPVYSKTPSYWDKRAEIIRKTYENAVAAGDKNVFFIDGRTYFGDEGALCSIDGTHPNDLGFYYMAKAVKPILEEALKRAKTNK